MKTYSISSLIAMSLLLGSCYDLDRYPSDKLSSGTFWQTQDHADQIMMGVYTQMRKDNVFGISFGLECLSDVGTGYGVAGYERISRGTYDVNDGYCANKFSNLYEGVARANIVLQNIDKVNMSDKLKQQYKGEAKFLRALYYFTLMDIFGGVPIYDESVVVESSFSEMLFPRSTAEETRAFILKDLEEAITSLPVEWDQTNKGRATQNAAIALKGKVLLFAKDYKNARDAFQTVVDSKLHDLHPNYAELFKPGGDESSEMIFAIQNMGGVGTDYGMPMTFYMGTRASFGSCWNNVMASTSFVDSYEWKDGRPFDWEEVIPGFTTDQAIQEKTFMAKLTSDKKKVEAYPEAKQKLLDMYGERDPRMMQSLILPYTEYKGWVSNAPRVCEYVIAVGANEGNGFLRVNGNLAHSYLWRKFVAEHDMNGAINNRAHTPINFPIIRYADLLLMLAECHNQLDNQDDAVDLINKVRSRSNMPGINSGPEWLAASSKEQVFQRIMHERAVELAAEGLRYSDLRRWGKLVDLNGKKEKGFTGKVYYTRKLGERDNLWPIPSGEIDKNSNLTQNPGW